MSKKFKEPNFMDKLFRKLIKWTGLTMFAVLLFVLGGLTKTMWFPLLKKVPMLGSALDKVDGAVPTMGGNTAEVEQEELKA